MQTSIAISDFVLAAVSYAVTVSLFRLARTAAASGFLIIAVGASLGSLKFAQKNPSATLIKYHSHATWLASVVGVSLITADYHLNNRYQSRYFSYLAVVLLLAIPVVTIAKIFNMWSNKVDSYVIEVFGYASILSLLLSSIIYPNSSCLFGALMYIAAGLFGTQGTLYGVKRVDWFHYALALGNIAFFLALKYKPDPVYYKSR